MQLIVDGLSYRAAPLAVRERVFLQGEELRRCLGRIITRDSFSGGVILSTCNRTEVYVTAPDAAAAHAELDAFAEHIDPEGGWRQHAYRLDGEGALAHLFRVPAGMDSAIIGEAQILGQFKDSHELARDEGAIDAHLDLMMRRAISAAKRVRRETAIGRNPVGFGHAAVAQARRVFGSLAGRSVLLVGAGKMAGATARLLAGDGVGHLYFSTRTAARADALATQMPAGVEATSVASSRVEAVAAEVDLVICSTTADEFVLDRAAVARVMAHRGGRQLFLLDLAVPRDIDPRAAEIEGVHLYNIDDLAEIVARARGERSRELPAAEAIIREELLRLNTELEARRASPAIASLVARAEALRSAQVGRIDDPDERARMDRVTRALTARMLHGPISYLRAHPDDPEAVRLIEALFDLDQEARD